MVLFVGGGRWIRTTEAISSRFTVCPLWPLGNSPIFYSSERNAGAGRRTRTPDLLITNQLLYRLSYTGDSRGTRVLYHVIPKCQARIYKNMDFFCFAIVGFSGNRKIVIWRTGTDAPLGSPFGGAVSRTG